MNWKSLSGRQSIDVISYVKEYIKNNPTVEVLIGTDSQNHRRVTDYALVIALHTNRGSHIVYSKLSFPKITDRFSRLLKEVNFTIDIATQLRESGIPVSIMKLHFDLNPDPRYKSNDVVRTALGWAEGLGYQCGVKPNAEAASYAADHLLR